MNLRCNSCDGTYGSLDIRLTKRCYNKCPFCIERKSGVNTRSKDPDTEKMLDNILNINQDLRSTLIPNQDIESVLILGGEPLLHFKDLIHLIYEIKLLSKLKVYVTTSLPADLVTYPQFEGLVARADGVNISYHSGWKETNAAVYYESKYNTYLETKKREYLVRINRRYSHKIRINLNLSKYGVNSLNDLRYALNTFAELGCNWVKINELQDSPEYYVSFEDLTEEDLPSPYAHGCESVLYYQGLTYSLDSNLSPVKPAQYHGENLPDWLKGIKLPDLITLKRSCFLTEPSREATLSDLTKLILRKVLPLPKKKFRVMYEDGSVYKGWLKNEKE